jgi:hypothetical protein
VGIVNVAPVRETVVPIFVPLERGGRTLVLCACSAETIPGWLLVAAAVSTSASASTSSSAGFQKIHFKKYMTHDSRQFTIFKEYFTKFVGPGRIYGVNTKTFKNY